MRHFISIILPFFAFSLLHAQQTIGFPATADLPLAVSEKTIFYDLAGNVIPIRIQQYGTRKDVVLINLHDNEATSVNAAKRILQEKGGILIEIENNAERNIRFRLAQTPYLVDPNRIFSREGIKRSLDELGRTSSKAIDEVEKLGQRIIQLIPEDTKYVIALHNNTPNLFSAKEYAPGNKRSVDTKKIYLNPAEDIDDFFLTTDHDLYDKLSEKGFNTILQDNKNCTEDGSLSVYCGKRNIRYVNCETEHGKLGQYYKMMDALFLTIRFIEI